MPRYTYFGYRYAGVTATGPVVFRRWRSTPVSSVTREMERGSIVTGNAKVNRLIENVRWGMLSNSLSSPTDCPERDLIANIKSHGNRLQAGFLGTAILLPTLTFKANAPELAYSLLLQEAFPSWLYSVNQGATTVWERWNGYTKEKGFGPVGMNSFNHYAYGCLLEWLFSAAKRGFTVRAHIP